jgi:hypothetical protein
VSQLALFVKTFILKVSAIDDTQVYPDAPINVSGTIRYRF